METKTSRHFSSARRQEVNSPAAGQYCIYMERATIAYGRMRHVEESTDGLKIALEIIPAEGLSDMAEDVLFFTHWKDLTVGNGYLCFHRRGWELFFDPVLVQHVLNTAREQAGAPPEVRYLRLKEILSLG